MFLYIFSMVIFITAYNNKLFPSENWVKSILFDELFLKKKDLDGFVVFVVNFYLIKSQPQREAFKIADFMFYIMSDYMHPPCTKLKINAHWLLSHIA